MSEARYYAVLPNPFGIEPGVYLAVYDQALRRRFSRQPRLCRRVASPQVGLNLLGDRDFLALHVTQTKCEAMHGRCWYCGRPMNVSTIGQPDSAEVEHQVPRSSGWVHVNRSENVVMACRRCNNGAFPGKGHLNVNGFRKRLEAFRQLSGLMFYGEVLRNWRDVAMVGVPHARTEDEAEGFLINLHGEGRHFHTWTRTYADYLTGLQLPIPLDAPPFALGAPERLL
ncbi:HNH endonuclease [Deinococcus yunweiensis]|uniref:HNH endonuclease n=1 Tax=Deinococcus yunweiensis TaxID=367282 RepID=UPI00398F5E63